MRLLKADTDTANFIYRNQIPVSYSHLIMRISGTKDATGIFLQDIGRVQYRIRSNSVVDIGFDAMSALDNIGGGFPEATAMGVGAGACAASIAIPRGYFDDNVEFVNAQDTAEFEINFGPNIAAHIAASWLVELYAVEELGVNAYNLSIKQQEQNIAGAGVIPDEVNFTENIAALYVSQIDATGLLTLVATTISRIRYSLGNSVNGEFSTAAGLAKTNLVNRVEAAQALVLEVFAAKVGDISSKLEDQAQLTFTTTAAARVQTVSLGLMFNPNKLQETAALSAQRLAGKLTAKDGAGKKRTAATVRAIVGATG